MKPEALFELRRRTFDTPHFRGIEFIETEAKSILNHVPGNRLPFNWTINAYRGCSHSCSYCAVGETPVLMGDGRTKPMADLRVGDEIYGTERVGSYRRYRRTVVLDHWRTVKPAYRTVLADGTELITSADHRFLSNRGWKFVTGTESGRHRRPHLTLNNKLLGTGRFASMVKQDEEYRRGYLCGMIRGDANLGHYSYSREGRSHGDVHRFRLALADREPLDRTQSFLEGFGILTKPFLFSRSSDRHRAVHAIRTAREDSVNQIERLVEWPTQPGHSWTAGFLAGIFDAEGSYSRGILRICNCDGAIIAELEAGLRRFGLPFIREPVRQTPGLPLTVVRVIGGLRQHLRFFHLVDPALTRKRDIDGYAIKNDAPLQVVALEPLGLETEMYDITTGTGDFISDGVVSHNCFARSTHTYLDMDAGRDFETKIVVKVNAPELLRKELRAKRWKGELVAMGTNTDPYQRAEGKYKLTSRLIETLTEYRNPFSILTKGTLILRDLPLLERAAEVTDVTTAFSIPTFDEEVWRKSEPGTPHPRKRMEAVARLNEAGVPCGVLIAPILPGISDSRDQLKEVIDAALAAGATHIYPILLHLRPVVKEVYMDWLNSEYPDLVGRYEDMYRGKSYASSIERSALSKQADELMAGRTSVARSRRRRRQPKAAAEVVRLKSEQLQLL